MSHLLQKLENNEAILLMYLADELEPEDRADVEQMLSIDPGLQRELQRLRKAQETVHGAIAAADASSAVPLSERAAVRQVERVIRQWNSDESRRMAPEPPRPGLRYPWWVYPTATAAAIVLAFLAWWGNQDFVPVRQNGPIVYHEPVETLSPEDTERLERIATSLEDDEEFMQAVRRENALSAAESELLALSGSHGDVLGLSSINSN